jgi:hypothetical protein
LSFFSLPPYAPQYNPDELLNNTLKQNIHRSLIPDSLEVLKRRVLSFMRSVQKRPALVRSFFEGALVQYAKGI